ncbi:monothiol glutaredoxin-S9-like [Ananas comosus]|uniref:Monothiol glutaredoxin-S9-like n=1 Tax=Ananas comosus TaxID=4615 RepID=A0A6P5GJ17_ANACO|nr:monothiol glutaredoxin-S9-like [Ananas comosus]
MHQAIPYSSGRMTWLRPAASASVSVSAASSVSAVAAAATTVTENGGSATSAASWRRPVAESAAAVVGRRGCCMSHVVRRLLQGLGVNPTVCDVDDEASGADAAALAEEFARIGAGEVSLPAVFIGGRLMGGLDRLMALHISGELVPMLKQAGALWL